MSIMADIAAVIRGKLNAMTTAINGKAASVHTHTAGQISGLSGASKYVGTDAGGTPGVYTLPSGGANIISGIQRSDGSRANGSPYYPWIRMSNGQYRISLASLGLGSTLNAVNEYKLNNGVFMISDIFNYELQVHGATIWYCDSTNIYVTKYDRNGSFQDSGFGWTVFKF
jgi:hypothetical protein